MVGQLILVCIEAGREVTDYALDWAVQNVIKPMDSLILLAVISSHEYNSLPVKSIQPRSNSKGFFSWMLKKRSNGKNDMLSDKEGFVDDGRDIPQRVYNVCEQMIHHLFSLHKVVKVQTEVKVIAYAPVGSVAMVATEMSARWVILDQRLKNEADCCIKQYLNCNIVLIDNSFHKILRSVTFPLTVKIDQEQLPTMGGIACALPAYTQVKNTKPNEPDLTPSLINMQNTSLFYSTSSSSTTTENAFQKTRSPVSKYIPPRPKQNPKSQQLNNIPVFEMMVPRRSISIHMEEKTYRNGNRTRTKDDMKTETETIKYPARRSVDLRQLDQRERSQNPPEQQTLRRVSFSHINKQKIDRTSSVRRDMSLSLKKPPTPPPLCSVCKNSVPVIGRSPQRFSHEEIEKATDGFSTNNFLAEGGYGQVYRGVLSDGQVVAVKKRKMVSAQGAAEFCSEVEVLKSAQHKNLVMLIGYCIEKDWLLVYEFACNGSLDKHLYGTEEGEVMTWKNRMKVACGAARALRYLHEDCRVGCIVHRDFRPSNILLTHDFDPMVGDFGLARWQADGQLEEETRVVGAFGYLAPEYTQTGLITEKADVYAFGVVLLEILTGIKAIDFSRTNRQQNFPDWGRSLLVEGKVCAEMIDSKLENMYDVKEIECVIHAASLCISPYPEQRPRMSKVLRILEGNFLIEKRDYHQEQSNPAFLRPSVENYESRKDILSKKQVKSQHPKLISVTKLSSIALKLENSRDTILKPKTPHKHEITTEYQEYLQGSLHKHIQSINME